MYYMCLVLISRVCVCMCVYVCMYVCMCVCVCVCVCVQILGVGILGGGIFGIIKSDDILKEAGVCVYCVYAYVCVSMYICVCACDVYVF